MFDRRNLRAHALKELVRVEGKEEKIKGYRKLENQILKRLGINFAKTISNRLLELQELATICDKKKVLKKAHTNDNLLKKATRGRYHSTQLFDA